MLYVELMLNQMPVKCCWKNPYKYLYCSCQFNIRKLQPKPADMLPLQHEMPHKYTTQFQSTQGVIPRFAEHGTGAQVCDATKAEKRGNRPPNKKFPTPFNPNTR
jgi:hypothetical protein